MEYFDAANMGPNFEGGNHEDDDDDDWKSGGKDSSGKITLPLFRGGLSELGEGWFAPRREKDEFAPSNREGFLAPLGLGLSADKEAPVEPTSSADYDRSGATEDVARMIHGVPEFAVSAAARPEEPTIDESWRIPRTESPVPGQLVPDSHPPAPAAPSAEHAPAPPHSAGTPPSLNQPNLSPVESPPVPPQAPAEHQPQLDSLPEPPPPALPDQRLPSGYNGGNILARLSGGGSDYYYYHSRYNNAAPLLAGVVAAEHVARRHHEKKQEREIKKLEHKDEIQAKQLAQSADTQTKLADQNRVLTEQVDALQLQQNTEQARRVENERALKAKQEQPKPPPKMSEHMPPPASRADKPAPPQSSSHEKTRQTAQHEQPKWWETPQAEVGGHAEAFDVHGREAGHRVQPELLREQTQDAYLAAYTAAATKHAVTVDSYHKLHETAQPAMPTPHSQQSSINHPAAKVDTGLARAWVWFIVVLIVLAVIAAAKAML